MKTKLLPLLCIFVFAISCKEQAPFIDTELEIKLFKDTTYFANQTPVPQDQNVLIEDITGVRCPNCPDAAKVAHDLIDEFPTRVAVSTIHPNILRTLTTPITDDFRTEEGTLIVREILGEPTGLPQGAINRIFFDGSATLTSSEDSWRGKTQTVLAQKSKANLELEVTENKNQKVVSVNCKSTFLEDQSVPVRLTVQVVESHLVSKQKTAKGVLDGYEHNFVLREIITPYYGIKLGQSLPKKNQVFEKGVTINIRPEWEYKNCTIIVMINRFGESNREIVQVAKYDLKE